MIFDDEKAPTGPVPASSSARSEHAGTVLISRNMKAGCEADFERVSATLMQVAASLEGFLGAQLSRRR